MGESRVDDSSIYVDWCWANFKLDEVCVDIVSFLQFVNFLLRDVFANSGGFHKKCGKNE